MVQYLVGIGLSSSLAFGCQSEGKKPSVASAQASASPGSSIEPTTMPPHLGGGFEVSPGKYAVPSGPVLELVPGQGAGPIRLGDSIETVEKHIGGSCDIKTAELCDAVAGGMDFRFKDGKLEEIQVSRVLRVAAPGTDGSQRKYGVFNGFLRPNVRLGDYRGVVITDIGSPLRTDSVPQPNKNGTFEVAQYDGMALEFDQLENENNVLGSIIIRRPGPPPALPQTNSDTKAN